MIDQLWFSFFFHESVVGNRTRGNRVRWPRNSRETSRSSQSEGDATSDAHAGNYCSPRPPLATPTRVVPFHDVDFDCNPGEVFYTTVYIISIKYYFYLIIFLLINNSFDDLFNLSNFLVIKNIYLPIVLKIGTGLLV